MKIRTRSVVAAVTAATVFAIARGMVVTATSEEP